MKKLPIPEMDQINSILDGSMSKLIAEYYDNPVLYIPGKYITINRTQMLEFLKKNPDRAKKYFEKIEPQNTYTNDIYAIIKESDYYFVAWMDHGIPRDCYKFQTLEEAVTSFTGTVLGIYESK